MRKALLLLAISLMFAPSAYAAACAAGNMGDAFYSNSASSCTIGGLTFSDFNYGPASDPAGNVLLSPDTGGPFGFEINPQMTVGSGQSLDALIKFVITGDAATLITDLHILFNGSASGTGTTGFTEQYCLGGTAADNFSTCAPGNLHVISVTNPPPVFQNDVTFAGVMSLWVTKDIVASGGANGSAMISDVHNDFSTGGPVPEPASMVLLGTGLLGLGGVIRRRLLKS